MQAIVSAICAHAGRGLRPLRLLLHRDKPGTRGFAMSSEPGVYHHGGLTDTICRCFGGAGRSKRIFGQFSLLQAVTLQTLTLSAAAFHVGDPQGTVVGTILGASPGCTITFNSLGRSANRRHEHPGWPDTIGHPGHRNVQSCRDPGWRREYAEPNQWFQRLRTRRDSGQHGCSNHRRNRPGRANPHGFAWHLDEHTGELHLFSGTAALGARSRARRPQPTFLSRATSATR
jgi:hypothetical protein